jgi:thiosulfate/3-mercaptopyruvate sulfurtransferase
MDPVIDPADVPAGAVLVDVRWYPDGRDGRAAYVRGHLPGARYVDLGATLSAAPSGASGRHPLPDPATFAAGLGAIGIGEDDVVVAYDDADAIAASRLVWMLRILRHPASVLDGGLAGWSGALETGWPDVQPAARRAEPWPADAIADADAVVAHLSAGGVVADCRSAARYRGEPHPLDAVAGHVPGAVSLPYEHLVRDGRFLPPARLRERFRDAGVAADAIVYCGSGVSACVDVLAAERAGLPRPRVYVGSWSGWTADPTRPVEGGSERATDQSG